jgi:pyridoxal phosphate enzyme (YggS family)
MLAPPRIWTRRAGGVITGAMSIADNLAGVLDSIARAARRAGRDPQRIKLVAVSKLQPAVKIREAYAAGCRDFGENYGQELLAKAAELGPSCALRWHHIGHLQRNKVKQLVGRVALFHGVDRSELGEEIERRSAARGCVTDVLAQVNIADEESKSGCHPTELPALVAALRACPHVRLRGLMTMPPAVSDAEHVRPHFVALRELCDRLVGAEDAELSMGMSQDYEVAVEEGATLVRVGTAIFGERD